MGVGTLYALDTHMGTAEVVGKASLEYCEGTCVPAVAEENGRYKALFPEVQHDDCGMWNPQEDLYSLRYTMAGQEKTMQQTRFVACLE